ncbi:4-hydroxyphenylacetate 3-monooxygenase, oxygenase component [Bacillus alkalicellulosilyticus]|uniref:4-hydroxyphenylacetate 3-monooxygenase, oxygenase component n=1 Tax=Alkalihalobacterium alkalicellulosilyticum TaxID=1912214 RepID=UPI0009963361|nr:4-hydroxyphenylacetate 3-monooxygenase, oxygenase component [Bacillus alkalicellulosilyticus]
MAIITGKQYINRIDDLQNEVWIEGERVEGKLSLHPAFRGILKSKGLLYDMQHDPSAQSVLTRTDNECDELINFSFKQPVTMEDLQKRKEAIQLWARKSGGTIGRSPDYINTAIMTLATSHTYFDEPYATSIKTIYNESKKKDLSFTHTFINPQANRSPHYFESLQEQTKEQIIAAKIIEKKEQGIVIHGARLLATQGGMTDEILVLPVGGDTLDDNYIYAFAIPSNTPGLRFLCREPYASQATSSYDHPFTYQFDEIDSVVVFDHVLVPWERVFIYQQKDIVRRLSIDTNLTEMLLFQAISRQVVKTEFLLGICESIATTISVHEYQHVQDKISEVITTFEIMKSLLESSINGAAPNRFGTMVPARNPLMVASTYYQKTYPRLIEILHLLGASGLIALPTENDFSSSIGADLHQYLQAKNAKAKERVQLFRLAWDLTMSPFGSRQTQYERFFFGDPIRQSSYLYQAYDKSFFIKQIKEFLKNCTT